MKKRFYALHGETKVIRIPVACMQTVQAIVKEYKNKCKKDKKTS